MDYKHHQQMSYVDREHQAAQYIIEDMAAKVEKEKEFDEKREKVESRSVCYNDSKAFRMALDYIERQNPELYRELIETEYNAAFG